MASQPKPPSASSQAAAQQAAEMGAAQTSAIVNNPNTYTPYGSQTYAISGYETVKNAEGKDVQVPRYTQTQTFSKSQQELFDLQNAAMKNLGELGVSQSDRLQGLLGKPMDMSGISGWQSYGKAPGMDLDYGRGGNIQKNIGNAGRIQNTYGSGGKIQRGIAGGGKIAQQIGKVGQKVQGTVGSGGTIRQDQGPTDRAAIEQAMMGRFNTDAARSNAAEDAQLAARGLSPGARQYSNIDEQRGRERTDAVQQAYLASGAESRAAQDAYNAAQQQRYGQGMERAQFANSAQGQMFEQAAQRAGFQNAAQMQQFQQNAAQGQFRNQAQQQAYDQIAQRAGFANAAQMQRYQQKAGSAAFHNAAQQQGNQQNAAASAFANQGRQQNFANQTQWADLMNSLRGGQMQERTALRNQPLNEIAALMSGSQVTAPQFQAFSRQGVNAAPIGQYMGQNYANQAQAAAQFNQGLFGLGGAGLGAFGSWLGGPSDRRLKEAIEPTGEQLAGVPVYRFRFIDLPGVHVGVMSDEVRDLHPDAVITSEITGFDVVNYGLLMERAA